MVEDAEFLFNGAVVSYLVGDLESIGTRYGRDFCQQFKFWPMQDGFIDSASYPDAIRRLAFNSYFDLRSGSIADLAVQSQIHL